MKEFIEKEFDGDSLKKAIKHFDDAVGIQLDNVARRMFIQLSLKDKSIYLSYKGTVADFDKELDRLLDDIVIRNFQDWVDGKKDIVQTFKIVKKEASFIRKPKIDEQLGKKAEEVKKEGEVKKEREIKKEE